MSYIIWCEEGIFIWERARGRHNSSSLLGKTTLDPNILAISKRDEGRLHQNMTVHHDMHFSKINK